MNKAKHKRIGYLSIDCGPPRPTENHPKNLPSPIFIVAITEKASFLDVRTFTTEDPEDVCGQALKNALDKFGIPDRLVCDLATSGFSRCIRSCAGKFNINLRVDPLYHATRLERLLIQNNGFGQDFSSIEQFDQHLRKGPKYTTPRDSPTALTQKGHRLQ